jgi:Tfp pilus assembly protein PilN
MPDLEFLPPWYVSLQRKRRTLRTLTLAAAMLAAGLGLWRFLAQRNTAMAQETLEGLERQSCQVERELKEMEHLESLLKQFRQQDDVLQQMGLHVESGRLIARLAEALPESVSLTSLSVAVDERGVQATGMQRATQKDQRAAPAERRMNVRVGGVAPSDVELAAVLTELSRSAFLENVTPVYSRDRREGGRVLREFEVTFWINLNSQATAEAR